MALLAGLDGCRGGWLWTTLDSITGTLQAGVVRSFPEFLALAARPEVIAIDIPIGLPSRSARACDLEARSRLGPRRNSVFPAPIRPVLETSTYGEACQLGSTLEGRKLSRQAFAILAKIREVDDVLKAGPGLAAAVIEVHPELCFWAMNGQVPLRHPKRTAAGAAEREDLLHRVFPSTSLPDPNALPKGASALDDFRDALAALWTAGRIHCGASQQLPSPAPKDEAGLPMRMVF